MARDWDYKGSNGGDDGYLNEAGVFDVVIDNVQVLPEDGTPQMIKVRFKDAGGRAIINDYRFTKKDGSENYGAIKAFESLLRIVYGNDFSQWDEDDLVGLNVKITVTPSEWDGRTFYNVSRVDKSDNGDI